MVFRIQKNLPLVARLSINQFLSIITFIILYTLELSIKLQPTVFMEQYKLGQLLGEGSFAKVYEAVHILTNIKVAIKIIKKNLITSEIMRERINCEIYALKKLSSPYIAQLLQIFEDTNKIYLVIEFASNKDLFTYLKNKGSMNEEEVGRITYQILCACKYMHEEGIAHRDLKLANIMLTDKMNVKIGDFGFSKPYQSGKHLHTSCGSPCFAAPELLDQTDYEPQKIDIWSIGVVCYSMLAATLPFYHDSIHRLYKIIQKCEYTQLAFVTQSCRDFIAKIFQRDPQKRLNFNGAFTHTFIKVSSKNTQFRKYRNFQTDPLYQKLVTLKNETILKILQFIDPQNLENYHSALSSHNFDKYYANIAILRTLSQQELEKKLSTFGNNSNQLLIKSLKLKSIKEDNFKVAKTRFNHSNHGQYKSNSPITITKNINPHLQHSNSPTSPILHHFKKFHPHPQNSVKIIAKSKSISQEMFTNKTPDNKNPNNKTPQNKITFHKNQNHPIRRINSILNHNLSGQSTCKIYKSLENTNFTSQHQSINNQSTKVTATTPDKNEKILPYNICHTVKLNSNLDTIYKNQQNITKFSVLSLQNVQNDHRMKVEYMGQKYQISLDKIPNIARKVIKTVPHSSKLIKLIKQQLKCFQS